MPMEDAVLTLARNHKDEWYKTVIKRIKCVSDLGAVEGKHSAMNNFRTPLFREIKGS